MNRFDIMLKKTPPPPTPPPVYRAIIDDGKINRNGRIYDPGVYTGLTVYAGNDSRPIGIVSNISPHSGNVSADYVISGNLGQWATYGGGGGGSIGNFTVGGGGNSGGTIIRISGDIA